MSYSLSNEIKERSIIVKNWKTYEVVKHNNDLLFILFVKKMEV